MNKADNTVDQQFSDKSLSTSVRAGFWLRMAAILYDSLLLIALLFLATAIALPLNKGEAFKSDQYIYHVYLLTVCFLYYAWFWTHGGQTPGMKAWKLKLTPANHSNNARISWKQAEIRLLAALLSWLLIGLGFVMILFNKKKLALHDRLSNSHIVYLSRLKTPHLECDSFL